MTVIQSQTRDTDVESAGSSPAPSHSPRSHLFVVMECDRPQAGGARYALEGVDEVIVGRGLERIGQFERVGARQRLLLRIPGNRMSAHHAKLVRSGTRWELSDMDSTNGVHVNGHRIARTTIDDGDCIQLGRTILTYRHAQPTPLHFPPIVDSLTDMPDAPELASLDPQVTEAFDELMKLAGTSLPIVLVGESGTGKEVVAQALHRHSGRSGSFVAVNCGTIPSGLTESLLFGHVRGAYSGAVRDETGFIRNAEGGTLFLDEVDALPHSSQVALLRVLQESEVVPLGCSRAHRVNVRVIAASHRPLAELDQAGTFRQDLRARLEGHTIRLAPLMRRREDLGVIIAMILSRICRAPPPFQASVGALFWQYAWPLNIRELEMVLRRAIALAGPGPLRRSHLPAALLETLERSDVQSPRQRNLSPDEAKLRATLESLLRTHRGNVSEVARTTGKARTQIQRWLRRFDLKTMEYRDSEK